MVVDLDEPRMTVRVEEHVEPEDLEAWVRPAGARCGEHRLNHAEASPYKAR